MARRSTQPWLAIVKSSEQAGARAVFDALVRRSFTRGGSATAAAPHVRSLQSSDRLLTEFIVASLPASLIGIWACGAALATTLQAGATDHWLNPIAAVLNTGDMLADFLLGLLAILPLLIVAATVSAFWEVLFAVLRRRPPDCGWPSFSWLFVLLLPATTPVYLVALGASFGAVVGKHIFGGTGRYIVSPALLGVVFIQFAYPSALTTLPWSFTAIVGGEATPSMGTWLAVFLGREIGAIGTPSALACLLGGVYLLLRGAISARTVCGAIGGLVAAALILSLSENGTAAQLAWHWHLALGYFAFCAVFVTTDPAITPLVPAARWAYGALFGVLTVTIRIANPAHPEGTLVAALLASLCIPLIDYGLLQLALRGGRFGLRHHG